MTRPGRFDLPLHGFEVREIAMSGPIAITFQDATSQARAALTLFRAFRVEPVNGPADVLDPYGTGDVSGLLTLRAEAVTEAFATLDGTISIRFARGRHLIAGPATGSRSWRLVADRYELAARLDGGLEVHPASGT